MQRPAIVHVISSPARGAPREIMLRLLAAVDRDRYQTAVAFLREGWSEIEAFGLDSMLPEFEALDVPICIAGMERVRDVRGGRVLDGFFRDVHAGLLVSHLNRADMWAAALGWWGRVPTIRVVHGLEAWRTARPPEPAALLRAADRVLNRMAARIVCVSRESQRILLEYQRVPPHKLVLIPNGIDVARFELADAPFPPGRPATVGMVTRLHAEKGLHEFVAAVAGLQRARPGLRAVVAGHGPELGDLQAEAATLAAGVAFIGRQSDVPAVLADIDVWALPSYHEGTPLSLLEAMAAGRGIVASAVGGIPAVIEDGVTGLLVPSHDAATLEAALGKLVDDPELTRRLGAAAAAAAAEYSAGTMCARYASLYDTLLD